jgi:uncharacterized protein (TIGR00369 family)
VSSLDDILLRDCPDHPGWHEWRMPGDERFNRVVLGTMLVRDEGHGTARTRIFPATHHTNMHGAIHGGVVSALADATLFAGPSLLTGRNLAPSVTVELSVQFTGAGDADRPLDGLVTVLRETGRMLFAQGRIVQGAGTIAGFSGILRKIAAA